MKTPFPLGDHQYDIGKLNPMKQFHVTRRLLPALATVGMTVAQIKELKSLGDLADLLGPLSGVMAAMKDEDAEYIIFTCLGVVHRVDPSSGKPAPIVVNGQNRLMYEDIGMPQMLRLVFEVVAENMGGFMQELGALTASASSSPPAA